MRAPWHTIALGASVTMCLGMVLIVATRCFEDYDICGHDDFHSTLSWLLDDDWRVTFAAVLIGCCALVHLVLLHIVWTWRELRSSIVTGIRVAWTLGYVSAVAVAVFTVTEHKTIHYMAAFTMFVSMITGAALVLWWQRNRHGYTAQQTGHFCAIVLLVIAYVLTGNGWYEIGAIFFIVLYFNWLSLGDHWLEDIELDASPEGHVPRMAKVFVARGL